MFKFTGSLPSRSSISTSLCALHLPCRLLFQTLPQRLQLTPCILALVDMRLISLFFADGMAIIISLMPGSRQPRPHSQYPQHRHTVYFPPVLFLVVVSTATALVLSSGWFLSSLMTMAPASPRLLLGLSLNVRSFRFVYRIKPAACKLPQDPVSKPAAAYEENVQYED